MDLYWLPKPTGWPSGLRELNAADPECWTRLQRLANTRLDFLQTNQLDRALQRIYRSELPKGLQTKPVRLAVLSTSTADHLLPGLCVGALRRGLLLTPYVGGYGQYLQELSDRNSPLYAAKPTALLLAFDAVSLLGAPDAARDARSADAVIDRAIEHLRHVWQYAAEACGGQVIQQTVLPIFPPLAGSNEHRLPASPRWMVQRLNERMREAADANGVDLLNLDARIAEDGLAAWHSYALWHRAKQAISPVAAPLYGDLVARMLAAQQGRSSKCLVLDLDNTVWGGVIGDDGLEGIVVGQGSALGEAYLEFQTYAKELSRRGVILAVCSKNDRANALAPFRNHPDMVLRLPDIACFVANWEDKPANLRSIASSLNIGLDSLVLADDNPFERNLVRRELPLVAVLELPEDPARYARCISDSGCFEAVRITPEDFERTRQYQGNMQREQLRSTSTDIASYLKSLRMELIWQPFDQVGLPRVVQLINKTNQFNLTTRRYTEADVKAIMSDSASFTLQLRLTDMFGDNGIIAVVIGRPADGSDVLIDIWLMSCRVLGRQVEKATLNLAVDQAIRRGATNLVGEYRRTSKNGMTSEHYAKLGFAAMGTRSDDVTLWKLPLRDFQPYETFIQTRES